MRLRLSEGKVGMGNERVVVCEMMVGRKKGDQPPRVHSTEARQGISNGRRGPLITGLDEQVRRRDLVYLIGVIMLMSSRQDEERLLAGNYPGYPPPGRLQ